MPKLTTGVTTEVTQTTELKLSSKALAMLKARLAEHAELAARIKADQGRQKRLGKEVEEILRKEGQIESLVNGIDIDGTKVKLVIGSTKTLDKMSLMRAFGLTQEDLDEHTEEKPNQPYVRVTQPKKKKKGEEEGD